MIIAVVSDTHDRLDLIKRAVAQMQERKVELVIHCGDYIAPFSILPFAVLQIPFVGVFGNNDGEKKGLEQKVISIGGIIRQPPLLKEISGSQFLICHSPLPENEVLQKFGGIDFYLFGHTHEACIRDLNGIKVINPGEACGWLFGKATFAVLNTQSKQAEIVNII